MPQRPGLARAVGVEERQLPTPGVAAEQREVVLGHDRVHAQVTLGEARDAMAVAHPERDVIEGLRVHSLDISEPASGYDRRAPHPKERSPAVA